MTDDRVPKAGAINLVDSPDKLVTALTLKGMTLDHSRVIALRAAFRVLPLVYYADERRLTLLVLRAVLLAQHSTTLSSASLFDTVIDASKYDLLSKNSNFGWSGTLERSATTAVRCAATVARSAVVARAGFNVNPSTTNFALGSVIHAASTSRSYADEFWQNIDADLRAFAWAPPDDILKFPLWNGALPETIQEAIEGFRRMLKNFGENWRLWDRWYDQVLTNASIDPFLRKSLIVTANQPVDFWGDGDSITRTSDKVMADIAVMLGWNGRSNESELGSFHDEAAQAGQMPSTSSKVDAENVVGLVQYKAALQFRRHDEYLVMASPASGDDERAAEEAATRKLHDNLRKLLPGLIDDIYEICNWPGRNDVKSAYDEMSEIVAGTTQHLASEIVTFWTMLCVIGSLLEADDDVALGRLGAPELPINARRKLMNMVRVAGPLARRFPTARELDDESSHYLNPEKRYGAATVAIAISAQHKLLSPEDIETLKTFIAAIDRGDVQSGKLRGLYANTGGNLVTKSLNIIGAFLLGATASVAGPEMVVVEKAAEVVVAAEAAVIEILEDVPVHSRMSAIEIINDLKKRKKDPDKSMHEHLIALRDRYRYEEESE